MMNAKDRRLPVGIQSFTEMRERGYLYVDKTDIVWNLVNKGRKYNYLSRPRRFGKSILVDTLQAYLEGRRELFEGLRICAMEHDWTCHPVIRLDMSGAGATPESLRSYFDDTFYEYEEAYSVVVRPNASLAVRLKNIIATAYRQSGERVAVLVDEYDSPLQHSWHQPSHEACTDIYREVFAVLMMADSMECFVFVTGITKFTQISLFSVLNNLSNISFDPQYAAICGITAEELTVNFAPEIKQLALASGWSGDEALANLKAHYDGYHFSVENMVDIYNPFSLINALYEKRLRNFWAASGSASLLMKFVSRMEIRLNAFDHCRVLRNTLETSDVTGGGAELFLYQSGYVTIKSADEFGYVLGFPNEEVRQSLNEMVLPALTLKESGDVQSLQAELYRELGVGDTDGAKKTMKALVADVPYSNKKMASMNMEERYRLILSTVLNAIGARVEVERMLSTGRIDIVAWIKRYVYVIELKLTKNGGLRAAERQILENGYKSPFEAGAMTVIGLAVELDDNGKGLVDWMEV